MSDYLFELFRGFFQHYGYWAVAAALLLENAGIPVPGETILLFASFLAFSEDRLHLPVIILVGTLAATLGDNLGYFIGNSVKDVYLIPAVVIVSLIPLAVEFIRHRRATAAPATPR